MRSLARHAAGNVAVALDRAFLRLSFRSRGADRRAARASVLDRLDRAAARYRAADEAGRLFPAAAAPDWVERPVRALRDGTAIDLAWPSAYRPIDPDHARTLARCPRNAVCHARWYRHRRLAPALVCLHGWAAGHFWFEERAYRAAWLYGLGLDVVFFTLPFHGRRRPPGRLTPMFPSTDPVRTNEGFAQGVLDIRALAAGLRARGAPSVGVSGMSLGGFTAALLATVDPDLDFAVPILAFSSVPDLLWEHGAGTDARRRAEAAGVTRERFAAAFAATSPLERPPVLDGRRVLLVHGELDRVVRLHHALRLQSHFPGATMELFPGAHLLQLGRDRAFDAIARFLRGAGVLGPA